MLVIRALIYLFILSFVYVKYHIYRHYRHISKSLVKFSCKMFRFIIIDSVLVCAAAQFPYSIDEKIKCVIEYYLNKGV